MRIGRAVLEKSEKRFKKVKPGSLTYWKAIIFFLKILGRRRLCKKNFCIPQIIAWIQFLISDIAELFLKKVKKIQKTVKKTKICFFRTLCVMKKMGVTSYASEFHTTKFF